MIAKGLTKAVSPFFKKGLRLINIFIYLKFCAMLGLNPITSVGIR